MSEIVLRIRPTLDNPPPPNRAKCPLRQAVEAIPIGHNAFIQEEDSLRVQRMVERIRRLNPSARFCVRKQKGGVHVWRKS